MEQNNYSPRSRLVCSLLCLFLGYLGVHRFYTRKIATGILMLCTAGGLGIWWVIDLIFVICGSFRDKEGRFIRHWFEQA